jgi:hypothetical protein
MPYDPGKGALFRNAEKKSDQHPDYRGEANIDGELYRLNAWLRTAKSGSKYMSLSFRPKEPDVPSRKPAMANTAADVDDEIPF